MRSHMPLGVAGSIGIAVGITVALWVAGENAYMHESLGYGALAGLAAGLITGSLVGRVAWWFALPAAFVLPFMLLAPVWCGIEVHSDPVSLPTSWNCQTILGFTLPGFAGQGSVSPTYLPALAAGSAAMVTLALVRRMRPTEALPGPAPE